MFQFSGFASYTYVFSARYPPYDGWVSPFGNRWIKTCLPVPQRLSQVSTSFIASDCQGIHRMRLVTWLYNPKESFNLVETTFYHLNPWCHTWLFVTFRRITLDMNLISYIIHHTFDSLINESNCDLAMVIVCHHNKQQRLLLLTKLLKSILIYMIRNKCTSDLCTRR